MTKSNFEKCLRFILLKEGGSKISNNPKDPGGLTKYGISIRFAGSVGLDINGDGKTNGADIVALTEVQASEVYKKHFWDKLELDRFPLPVALLLLDGAVNQGPAAAARDLQAALGVVSDGQIGPKTMNAVKWTTPNTLCLCLVIQRGLRYTNTRNFDTFGKGWTRRLMDCALEASRII